MVVLGFGFGFAAQIVLTCRTNFLSHSFLPSIHWEIHVKLFTYSIHVFSKLVCVSLE